MAEERPQGIASALLELFRRLLQNAYRTYWVRELQQSRSFHSGPVRRGAADRTTRPGMSSGKEELKGESAETVADGGIGLKTLPDAGEENNRTEIGKISFDADQGRLQERVGGFHLAVSLYT